MKSVYVILSLFIRTPHNKKMMFWYHQTFAKHSLLLENNLSLSLAAYLSELYVANCCLTK